MVTSPIISFDSIGNGIYFLYQKLECVVYIRLLKDIILLITEVLVPIYKEINHFTIAMP